MLEQETGGGIIWTPLKVLKLLLQIKGFIAIISDPLIFFQILQTKLT